MPCCVSVLLHFGNVVLHETQAIEALAMGAQAEGQWGPANDPERHVEGMRYLTQDQNGPAEGAGECDKEQDILQCFMKVSCTCLFIVTKLRRHDYSMYL